jgi:hypothetical protein
LGDVAVARVHVLGPLSGGTTRWWHRFPPAVNRDPPESTSLPAVKRLLPLLLLVSCGASEPERPRLATQDAVPVSTPIGEVWVDHDAGMVYTDDPDDCEAIKAAPSIAALLQVARAEGDFGFGC